MTSKYKILMVQETPCIRNVKTATMFRSNGHRVDCAVTVDFAGSRLDLRDLKPYDKEIKVNSYPELINLCENYDIVHMHNGPDRLGALCLASRTPVVWDCHDLISSLEIDDPRGNDRILEIMMYRKSAGVIFASPGFSNYCNEHYGNRSHQIISYNYPLEKMLKQPLEKLSVKDGQIHVVYAGSLSEVEGNHRNFLQEFWYLIKKIPEATLHIYPAISPTTAKSGFADAASNNILEEYKTLPSVRFMNPVSPFDLIRELSQYDWGWIPFKKQYKFTDLFIPNKLYEYAAANLNILTRQYETVYHESKDWKNIFYYENLEELPSLFQTKNACYPQIEAFESQYHKYLTLYKSILS